MRLSQHRADLEFELEGILAGNAARSRRYAEGYIAPGDRVHVYGGQLGDSDAPGADATVVGGDDGRYRITGGGASTAARGFVRKAAVTGSMSLVAGGGAIVALSAAL